MNAEKMDLADALALGMLDAHAQAQRVARGDLQPRDLVEAALMRARLLDPELHAISHWDSAAAIARAEYGGGVAGTEFAGVPYLVKDSLDHPGMPTHAGSRSRGDTPVEIAPPYLQRFNAAGLVAIGKSGMPEAGLMPSTEPLRGPVTRNPWSPVHSPGGSSGGAAAAVASGIVPLAHGSDGAGSIRMPAACCGIVGLKPGRGAVVQARARHAIEDLLVADVLLSRTVRDTAWAFATAHPDAPSPIQGPTRERLRIAVIEDNATGRVPHPDVADAVAAAATVCEQAGHQVERAAWPLDGAAFDEALKTLWSRLAADLVDVTTAAIGASAAQRLLEPWTLGLAAWHRDHCDVGALERAYAQLATLPARFTEFHRDYDVILSPVVRTPPPLLGQLAPDRDFIALFEAVFDWMSYTPVQNLAGTPAISLPLWWNAAGLPVGVQFIADRGDESRLLELAFELEAIVPWRDRWPPLSVVSAAATLQTVGADS